MAATAGAAAPVFAAAVGSWIVPRYAMIAARSAAYVADLKTL